MVEIVHSVGKPRRSHDHGAGREGTIVRRSFSGESTANAEEPTRREPQLPAGLSLVRPESLFDEGLSKPVLVGLIGLYSNLSFPHVSGEKLVRALKAARAGKRATPQHHIRDVERRLGAEKIAQIVAEYEAGESTRALETKYGVGKTAIVSLLRKQNVTIRNQPIEPELVERALELRAAGMGYKSIAKQLGVPKESMRQAMLRAADADVNCQFDGFTEESNLSY